MKSNKLRNVITSGAILLAGLAVPSAALALVPDPTPVDSPTPSPAYVSPTSTPSPSPTPTPVHASPTPSPSPTPTPSSEPAQISVVEVDGKTFTPGKNLTIKAGQSLKLIGTATPNALVTLTIHSTPKTVTTTADNFGNWNYTLTGLATGNHFVEATVTDPTTKKVSAATKLLSFKVATPTATTTAAKPAKSHTLLYIILLALLLVIIVLAIWLLRRKRKARATSDAQVPMVVEDGPHDTVPEATPAETLEDTPQPAGPPELPKAPKPVRPPKPPTKIQL